MKPKKHYQVKPKKTLSSEAKENVWLAQKYKIRNVSRVQDKTCKRRIKIEKQEHKRKIMQYKDEKRKQKRKNLVLALLLNTSMVKPRPKQLGEAKPRKLLEMVI